MVSEQANLLELLRYADRSYTLREAVYELVELGVPKAQASQQIIEALTAGRILKAKGEKLALSERERSGW